MTDDHICPECGTFGQFGVGGEFKTAVQSVWEPIASLPKNGGSFVVIGDNELAIAWWEPEAGMQWKLMSVPGMGVRLGSDPLLSFHSWCTVADWHRQTNRTLNPAYYGE